MKIVYLGNLFTGSTSFHRFAALQRLGHQVCGYDPYKEILSKSPAIVNKVHYRTGYRLLQNRMLKWVQPIVGEHQLEKPDLLWVDSGELLGKKCVQSLKKLGAPIFLYNGDDPTGNRDGRRFDALLNALPVYDLCTSFRKINNQELKSFGVQNIIEVMRSYDEVVHAPFASKQDIPKNFHSDVAFIGTWMRYEKRDLFVSSLLDAGVHVSIWGARWPKSPIFSKLKPNYRGASLKGKNYVAAMQGAKICLGLLSRGNRDQYTRRSLEIPFAGGLLCAERTPAHQDMYLEGNEAVFWSDVRECASVCKDLLADEPKRERIRAAGMKKVRAFKLGNEDVCLHILDAVAKL